MHTNWLAVSCALLRLLVVVAAAGNCYADFQPFSISNSQFHGLAARYRVSIIRPLECEQCINRSSQLNHIYKKMREIAVGNWVEMRVQHNQVKSSIVADRSWHVSLVFWAGLVRMHKKNVGEWLITAALIFDKLHLAPSNCSSMYTYGQSMGWLINKFILKSSPIQPQTEYKRSSSIAEACGRRNSFTYLIWTI